MKAKKVKVLHYCILTIIAVIFILPLIWLGLAALDANASQALKIPTKFTIQNFISVLTNQKNLQGFAVGLAIALMQSSLVVILAGLAAYPLSRYHLRYKKWFMNVILFMTALPMIAVIVPVYRIFLKVHLLDSICGVILYQTAASLPYGIWLMKNFMDGIPLELEEAARVDGCTIMNTIKKIVFPLMIPGICVVFIFTFTGGWGNFFVPYILLSSENKLPASVMLYQYFGQHGTIAYGTLAAYSLIYGLPSILLYMLAQKYMSKGFTMAGASKG